jgi:quinol-cytochrome oxidoreductase complex cytochrome b subunit
VTFAQFVKDPLEGKTSLSRVVWLYGLVGSLLYGSLELFLNPENQFAMRVYTIVGLIFTVYCIVGTYRCAKNTKSPWMARSARIGAIILLLLLPLLTYLELSGSLTITDLMGGQLPE